MSLLEQKKNHYVELLHGEEIALADISENFKDCWLYDGSVKINHRTIGLFNIESSAHKYKSLILSSEMEPVVTKLRTGELIGKYREANNYNYLIHKKVMEEVFEQSIYKFPEIEPDFLFVPLEGPSKGNVNYINFTMLNDVRAISNHESVLSFYNHLEIIIPQRIQSLEKHLDRAFEYYTVITYFSDSYKVDKESLSFVTHWEGAYPRIKKELAGKAVQRTSRNNYQRLVTKYQTKKLFPSAEDMIVIANFFLMYKSVF
ncbi:competence protein ComK [Vagococcus hydrophili]|uniref:Uncharacterized protein n=1 Tax=Vagococcus hydrophili TaxID=2714947 RepID=A0A6G8AQZ7_9ENTE|nr:competence protein ComK [Vagococcus hydrophili]QIL47410.1 hypothetical protein G7082_02110 [Vagococcus hydrophili]